MRCEACFFNQRDDLVSAVQPPVFPRKAGSSSRRAIDIVALCNLSVGIKRTNPLAICFVVSQLFPHNGSNRGVFDLTIKPGAQHVFVALLAIVKHVDEAL